MKATGFDIEHSDSQVIDTNKKSVFPKLKTALLNENLQIRKKM